MLWQPATPGRGPGWCEASGTHPRGATGFKHSDSWFTLSEYVSVPLVKDTEWQRDNRDSEKPPGSQCNILGDK